MKHRVIQIVVLLILGAIVTVAVAWAGVLWTVHPRTTQGAEITELPTQIPPDWPRLRRRSIGRSLLLTIETFDPPPMPDAFELFVSLTQTKSGFPLRSLQSMEANDGRSWSDQVLEGDPSRGAFPHTAPQLSICQIGMAAPQWLCSQQPPNLLPIDSLWPGFAINTIFYAAILWMLFFTPGMIKRSIRRRRGLCPACAYPVGISPVCTECGKALT